MRGLLTCHGEWAWIDNDDFCQTECPWKEECKLKSEATSLDEQRTVMLNVERRARGSHYFARYLENCRRRNGKRAITFGQLRRGLVLRKRREEQKR